MKFIKLESRGGNYLVVAENVAWLRTAENGQTSVGIIGGQPLLVVGSVEEVAAKILAGSAPEEPVAPPAPALVDAAPVAEAPVEAPEAPPAEVAVAPEPEPEPEPEPPHVEEPAPVAIEEAAPIAEEPVEAEPAPAPEPAPVAAKPSPPARPKPVAVKPMTLADRLARASAPTVKAGSQRLMSMSEGA